jgi:hypothetical protein
VQSICSKQGNRRTGVWRPAASRRRGRINNSKAVGHVENRRLCLIASNNAAVANKEEANGIVWGLSNRQ